MSQDRQFGHGAHGLVLREEEVRSPESGDFRFMVFYGYCVFLVFLWVL